MKTKFKHSLVILVSILVCVFGEDCNPESCKNGECKDNKCVCNSCWQGEHCDVSANNPPIFEQTRYLFNNEGGTSGKLLGKIQALDIDRCENCACAQLRYSLQDTNDAFLFNINENTGELYNKKSLSEGQYQIIAMVSNKPPFSETGSAIIDIIVSNGAEDETLRRMKRAVSAPSNVTFELKKLYPTGTLPNLQFGSRLKFELIVSFPSELTDMSLEFFVPDNTIDVMSLCYVRVVYVGSQLTTLNKDTLNNNAKMETRDGSPWPYNHAIFSLADVNPTAATSGSIEDYQLKFEFEVLMIYNPQTTNKVYWISAGAEYNNENFIWVCQASFTSDITTETFAPEKSNFTFTGGSDISPSRISLFELSMVLPYRYADVTLDVMTPLNFTSLMSICFIHTLTLGQGFDCINRNAIATSLSKKDPAATNFYKGTMNMGLMTNKMSLDNTAIAEDHEIKMLTGMRVSDDAIVDQSWYVGVSVSISGQLIWSAVKPVTIIMPPTLPAITGGMSAVMSNAEQSTINIKGIGFMDVLVTVPNNTETDFVLNVEVPVESGQARLDLCAVQIIRAGKNLPCLTQIKLLPTYGSQILDSYRDTLSVNLVGVKQIGVFGGESDSQFVMRAYFHVLEHTNNNAAITVKAKLKWIGGDSGEQSVVYNVVEGINISSIETSKLPSFEFKISNGMSNIKVGESRLFEMTMTLIPGQMYTPARMEIIMPFKDGAPKCVICLAQVVSVGKNVACLLPSVVNSKVVFTSKNNDTKYDKAVFDLGSLASLGDPNITAGEDDKVKFMFSVKHVPHTDNTNSVISQISMGMIISENQIWVSNQQLTTTDTATISSADLTADQQPLLFLSRVDLPNDLKVYKRDLIRVQMIVKIRPLTDVDLKVDIVVSGPANSVSVCHLRLISIGRRLPCVEGNATYTKFASSDTLNEKAYIDFGFVSHHMNTTFSESDMSIDENSIVMEALVRTYETTTGTINVKSEITFNGGTKVKTLDLTLYDTPAYNGTVNGSEPIISMAMAPLFENQSLPTVYVPGQLFRVVMSMKMLPLTRHRIKVTFSTPESQQRIMDITSVALLFAGTNVPCVEHHSYIPAYTKRSGSVTQDHGEYDMGTVINVPLALEEDDTSVIKIEAIGRIWKKTESISAGQTKFNALVFLNSDNIFVAQETINLTLTNDVPELFLEGDNITASVNSSAVPETVKIKDVFDVPFQIVIPQFSQIPQVTFSFKAGNPIGSNPDSALLVVKEIFLKSAGINLGGIDLEPKENFDLTLTSTRSTSQKDEGLLDIGIVQNMGLTHRLAISDVAAPDTIQMVYRLQLTANERVTNGTIFVGYLTANFGTKNVSDTFAFTIETEGTEEVSFSLSANLIDAVGNVFVPGSVIQFNGNVTMLPDTKGECSSLHLNYYTPNFLEFNSLNTSNFTAGVITQVVPMKDQAGMSFRVENFNFDDIIEITGSIIVKSDTNLKFGRIRSTVTIPTIANCKDRRLKIYKREYIALKAEIQGGTVGNDNCGDDLGMQSSTTIKDCQLSAFLSPYTENDHLNIRPGSSKFWQPFTRNGLFNNLRYFTVLFENLKKLTRIHLVAETGLAKPTKMKVYTTKDGKAFAFHDESSISFKANNNAIIDLMRPMIGRGVRVVFSESDQDNNAKMGLQMHLYGCSHPDLTPFTNVCDVKSFNDRITPADEFYMRGYLHTGSSLVYCDTMPVYGNDFKTRSACFIAEDSYPNSWREMGSGVANVIGFNPATRHFFGISSNRRTYMVSEDQGVTWAGLNDGGWKFRKDESGFVTATTVPWIVDGGFDNSTVGAACSKYNIGGWYFCFDGIYRSNTKHVSWNTCCPL